MDLRLALGLPLMLCCCRSLLPLPLLILLLLLLLQLLLPLLLRKRSVYIYLERRFATHCYAFYALKYLLFFDSICLFRNRSLHSANAGESKHEDKLRNIIFGSLCELDARCSFLMFLHTSRVGGLEVTSFLLRCSTRVAGWL